MNPAGSKGEWKNASNTQPLTQKEILKTGSPTSKMARCVKKKKKQTQLLLLTEMSISNVVNLRFLLYNTRPKQRQASSSAICKPGPTLFSMRKKSIIIHLQFFNLGKIQPCIKLRSLLYMKLKLLCNYALILFETLLKRHKIYNYYHIRANLLLTFA